MKKTIKNKKKTIKKTIKNNEKNYKTINIYLKLFYMSII